MRTAVIYYSQTGNTKRIARAIQQGLAQATGRCDLFPLRQAHFREVLGYDLIGVGCPVWELKEPLNVRIFMETLPQLSGKHCFLFATHGADRGGIFPSMARVLAETDVKIVGYRSWYGTVWDQISPKPYLTDGHPDEIDLKEAQDFGQAMAEASKRVSRGEADLTEALVTARQRRLTMRLFTEIRYIPENCTYPKCTLCMDCCPTGAIDLAQKPVEFMRPGRCLRCNYCELICPTGAIEGDFEPAASRFREVIFPAARELFKRGQERGYFRQLIPEEQVGTLGPLYLAYPRRPRFKLADLLQA